MEAATAACLRVVSESTLSPLASDANTSRSSTSGHWWFSTPIASTAAEAIRQWSPAPARGIGACEGLYDRHRRSQANPSPPAEAIRNASDLLDLHDTLDTCQSAKLLGDKIALESSLRHDRDVLPVTASTSSRPRVSARRRPRSGEAWMISRASALGTTSIPR